MYTNTFIYIYTYTYIYVHIYTHTTYAILFLHKLFLHILTLHELIVRWNSSSMTGLQAGRVL